MMPVTGLVPMIPVMDVERSGDFYEFLGSVLGNRVPREARMNWAWLYSSKAPNWRRDPNLMLISRSERASIREHKLSCSICTRLTSWACGATRYGRTKRGTNRVSSITFRWASLQSTIPTVLPHARPEQLRHALMPDSSGVRLALALTYDSARSC
jgi:hypothetical protein